MSERRSAARRWLGNAPWPVIFVVTMLGWALGIWAIGLLPWGERSPTELVFAAPFYAAVLTFVLVRWRRGDRAASRLDGDRHADAMRAVLRGRLPADPATWPGARVIIARQRERLHRQRWMQVALGVLAVALVALAVLGDGSGWFSAGLLLAVAVALPLANALQRRRLDAAEQALDAAEMRSGADRNDA
jgi:drug/metabolite transporter (DMT)-like permease